MIHRDCCLNFVDAPELDTEIFIEPITRKNAPQYFKSCFRINGKVLYYIRSKTKRDAEKDFQKLLNLLEVAKRIRFEKLPLHVHQKDTVMMALVKKRLEKGF